MENVLAWYELVAISAVGVIILLLVLAAAWWLYKRYKKNTAYNPLFEEAHDALLDVSPPQEPKDPARKYSATGSLTSRGSKHSRHSELEAFTDSGVERAHEELASLKSFQLRQYNENAVDVGPGYMGSLDYSMSAYGDLGSVTSLSRTDSLASRRATSISVHLSAYASYKKGFLAGKVIAVDGIPHLGLKEMMVKVHITVLPMKKYALRTSWFKVNEGLANIGAYFKFGLSGTASTSMMRMRVYASKKGGLGGRQKCLGQLVMNVDDVERSKGGVTVWEKLIQVGSSMSINEEP